LINPNNLPEGYTVEQTRFMWALCKDGKRISFGATEAAVRNAVNFQPEFYEGVVSERELESYVEL